MSEVSFKKNAMSNRYIAGKNKKKVKNRKNFFLDYWQFFYDFKGTVTQRLFWLKRANVAIVSKTSIYSINYTLKGILVKIVKNVVTLKIFRGLNR